MSGKKSYILKVCGYHTEGLKNFITQQWNDMFILVWVLTPLLALKKKLSTSANNHTELICDERFIFMCFDACGMYAVCKSVKMHAAAAHSTHKPISFPNIFFSHSKNKCAREHGKNILKVPTIYICVRCILLCMSSYK